MTVVLDGFACQYKARLDGKRQILSYLIPGDTSDLDSALLGQATHAIATLSTCTVAAISASDVTELFDRHPKAARALRTAKLMDEAVMREWIMFLGSFSASERMAHFFCELLIRLQAVGLV